MKRIMTFVTVIALMLCVSSCKENRIWVCYYETYCSDEWGNSDVPEKEKIENIKKYLRENKVRVFEVKIVDTFGTSSCLACHCYSGKEIMCEINEDDSHKIANKGFFLNPDKKKKGVKQ